MKLKSLYLVLLPVFCLSFSNKGNEAEKKFVEEDVTTDTIATILKAKPDTLLAQPTKGFRITYNWQANSIDKNYRVIVRFVDKYGKTVLEDDHSPPTPTSEWEGQVEYTRIVSLPVWDMINNNTTTIYVALPEGQYSVHTGLYDESTKQLQSLNMGPGVTKISEGLYKIGVLSLDILAPVPDPGQPTLDMTGYHLTFDEEFDDLSVSAWGPTGTGGTRWIAHTPWYGDFGDAKFTDPGPGFPFTVEDGLLRIEAREENGQWRSGLLSTVDPNKNGFTQKYGYFECRAKLPEGPGTWPAFWLMGTLNRWGSGPRINPEVDILEHYGHWPNRFSYALHLWGLGGLSTTHQGERIVVFGVEDDFHTYGMWIDEEYMILYFDGVEMFRQETPKGVKTPLYPLVNLALGPGWPLDKTPNPSYMYVDYVKVYDRYFRSDVIGIDWINQILDVPWGIYRDSLLHEIYTTKELIWEYQISGSTEDSLHQICTTGDSLTMYAYGDSLLQMDFRVKVVEPAEDMALVFPLNSKDLKWDGKYHSMFSVTENDPVMDSITGVTYATRVDTLLKYLEKAPDASWEIVWVDDQERTDLVRGDILRVRAENGTTSKDYYIDVDTLPEPSHNATLAAITWPDVPEATMQDPAWRHDTIPGFVPDQFEYTITVPCGINTVPALVAFPENINAGVNIGRAKTINGPVADRTTTITVTAEDDTTTLTYTVVFEKELLPGEPVPIIYSYYYIINDTLKTIQGVVTNTSVQDFMARILKTDDDQLLRVLSGEDGSEMASGDTIADTDTLEVTSADEMNVTKYVLSVSDEGLDSDAVLTSDEYTIEISGSEGTISGIQAGTTIETVLNNISIPADASLQVINENDELVPLRILNFDTVYVATQASYLIRFEVIAQDMQTKIVYRLQPAVSMSDAFVYSNLYEVDQQVQLISFIPSGITVPTLLTHLWTNKGASIKVVDNMGFERMMAPVLYNYQVVVTSGDGTKDKAYYLQFLEEEEGADAYVLSDVFTVNRALLEIYGITDSVTAEEFMNSIIPARLAAVKVVDENGDEKTSGSLEPGKDMLVVTSGNGKNQVEYSLLISRRYMVIFIVSDGTNPVDNAVINIGNDTLITNALGVASINLTGGQYEYSVTKGDASAAGTFSVADADLTENVTVRVPTYTVTMTVTDGTNPISGAGISMAGIVLLTNASGQVVFNIPNGIYYYTVTRPGYQYYADSVSVSDANMNLNLVLSAVSAHSSEDMGISIYPNPSQGKLIIERQEISGIMNVRISNVTGKVIFENKYDPALHNTINLENLEQGMYFIQLRINDEPVSRKLIIK